MVRFYFCVCLFFCFGLTKSYCQKSFEKGYIILLNGDTTVGFLKKQNSKLASKSCSFKQAEDGGIATKYLPQDLAGYRFDNGKFYISKEVNNTSGIEGVFLEYLIKGKASIFYFRDSTGDHFFVEKEGGELIELTEPYKVIRNPNGTGTYKAPSKYKGKLWSVMSDCPDINTSIEKTQLNYNSLVSLAKNYHERVCTTEDCVIYEKKKKTSLQFGLVTGYSMNQYNFGSKLITDIGNGYQLGLQLEFKKILFSNEKLGLTLGFVLEKDNRYTLSKFDKNDIYNERVTYYGIEYTINSNPDIFSVSSLDVDIDLLSLNIPILFNYYHDLKKVTLFAGGGLSNRFALKQNKEFKYNDFYYQYGNSINTFLIGGTANLGVQYKLNSSHGLQLSVHGDYLIDPRALNQFLRLKVSQLSFRLGYLF